MTASVLDGVDAVLVDEAGGPQGFIFSLLPRVGFCVDGRVVFVERIFVLVERLGYPQLSEVDVVGKNDAGDFV